MVPGKSFVIAKAIEYVQGTTGATPPVMTVTYAHDESPNVRVAEYPAPEFRKRKAKQRLKGLRP